MLLKRFETSLQDTAERTSTNAERKVGISWLCPNDWDERVKLQRMLSHIYSFKSRITQWHVGIRAGSRF